jgi:3',5'-cyclic AMP phosphodiesterase CpdA
MIKKFALIIIVTTLFCSCYTYDASILPSYEDENINDYKYDLVPNDVFSDFDFMVASDIHFLSDDLYDQGKAFEQMIATSNGQMQAQGTEIIDAFFNQVTDKQPDFMILTGDLTLNGEKLSHTQLAAKLQSVEDTGVDVLVVPGNHDINNVYARSFFGENQQIVDYVDFDDFSNIYAEFGPDHAIMKDESSFSYVVEKGNVWLLMIDSASYDNNVGQEYPESSGSLLQSQAQWFQSVLDSAKQQNKEIMTFMHHNMVAHADVSSFLMADFMIAGASTGMSSYLASNDMNIVFSGHIHCHDIAGIRYEDNFIFDITTGALITYPHNYRICQLDEAGNLSIQTQTIKKIQSDPRFGEYSKKRAYDVRGDFGRVKGVSEKDMDIMQRYAKIVANAYFEGTDDQIFINKRNIAGYSLWTQQNGVMTEMILGMSHDTEPRDRNITIDLNTGYWSE